MREVEKPCLLLSGLGSCATSEQLDNTSFRLQWCVLDHERKVWLKACVIIMTLCVSLLIIILIASGTTSSAQKAGPHCRPNAQEWHEALCCEKKCSKRWKSLPLIVLSFDGVWYKYLTRNRTNSFDVIRRCGSSADYMFPSYPSKTFPNHYTIVTGLYPETHGIVDNHMFDGSLPEPLDRKFSAKSGSRSSAWFNGEPIWNTAIKNDMKSAALYWFSSDFAVHGTLPTYYRNYTSKRSYEAQMKQIVDWLLLPAFERPSIILSYFSEPDATGHTYGPNSGQVDEQLANIDKLVDQLMTSLFKADLLHCFNLILLSDHGMKEINGKAVNIHEYLNTAGMRVFTGTVGRIMLENSSLALEEVEEKLKCHESFRTYRRHDVPKRYHYARTPRIGDLVLDMIPGKRIWQESDGNYSPRGDHGYDFKDESMWTIFIAYGPSFKKNYTIPPFQNIQLYNLFADVTGMQIRAPNNGTKGALNDILKYPPTPLSDILLPPQPTPCNSSSGFRSCAGCILPELPPLYPKSEALSSAVALTAPDRPHFCSLSDPNFRLMFDRQTNMPSVLQAMLPPGVEAVPSAPSSCSVISRHEWECDRYTSATRTLQSQGAALYPLLAVAQSATTGAGLSWESFYSLVPMFDRFYDEIWKPSFALLKNSSDHSAKVLTFMGPAFDRNGDGLADTLDLVASGSADEFFLPTHYFLIMFVCSDTWQSNLMCKGQPKAATFIFPHRKGLPCNMDFRTFAKVHAASIRDVELLTGFSFLYTWTVEAATRLKLDLTDHHWI